MIFWQPLLQARLHRANIRPRTAFYRDKSNLVGFQTEKVPGIIKVCRHEAGGAKKFFTAHHPDHICVETSNFNSGFAESFHTEPAQVFFIYQHISRHGQQGIQITIFVRAEINFYSGSQIQSDDLTVFRRSIGQPAYSRPFHDDWHGSRDTRIAKRLPAGQIVKLRDIIERQEFSLGNPQIRVE